MTKVYMVTYSEHSGTNVVGVHKTEAGAVASATSLAEAAAGEPVETDSVGDWVIPNEYSDDWYTVEEMELEE